MSSRDNRLHFFIGSYTEMLTKDFGGSGEGIYVVEMDLKTGSIITLNVFGIRNPAYLISNNDMLYAITEVEKHKDPKVSAFRVKSEGVLEFVNEQNVKGSLPCHINLHRHQLLIACYGSGNVLSFPLGDAGEILECTHDFKHKGASINVERQEAPHAHQAVIHPNGKYVFVPDLGIDMIKVYGFVNNSLKPKPEYDINIPKGNGPRHMVFNSKGNMGYVMNELTGNVAVLKLKNEVFECIQLYGSLPENFSGTPSGAAIRIHPNGNYLYVANRTVDAITIFIIEEEYLKLVDYIYTQGRTIREFNITPEGNWLIACLQDSNEVISYRIKPTGLLEEKHRTNAITSPVCIAF